MDVLDEYQRAAVDSDAQFLQIVGLPGTGKTRVLAHRIARLVDGGAAPDGMVVLAFTNSACASLRHSIAQQLGADRADLAERVRVSTFHAFARELIEQFPEDVGLTRDWALTDFLDAHNVLHYPAAASLARGDGGGGARADKAAVKAARIAQSRGILRDFQAYSFEQALAFGQKIAAGRELGLTHLFIDEFQDTTGAQFHFVETLVARQPQMRLAVAGDPNQEIFGFQADRLAHAMAHMLQTYPRTEVAYLRFNYRSTPQIVTTFQQITAAPPVTLLPTRPPGLEPALTIFDQPAEELEGVRALIQKLTARGCAAHDIAVLVRQNAQAQAVARYLSEHGVPAKHEMGVRAFGLRPKTGAAITLMKWSLAPKDFYLIQLLYNRYHQFVRRSDFAELLRRVGSSAPPGAQAGAQAGMQAGTQAGARPLTDVLLELDAAKYDHPFLTQFLPRARERLLASETRDAVISALEAALSEWKPAAGSRARPGTALSEEAAWTSFIATLRQCETLEVPAAIEAPAVTEASEAPTPVGLAAPPPPSEAAGAAGGVPRGAWLETLLKHLFARERAPGAADAPAAAASTRFVEVSTIHAAKSHEWPVVILPSVPQRGAALGGSQEAERCIAYVAASRAREVLHFTHVGPVRPGSLASFLPAGPDAASRASRLLTLEEARRRDPLVFKPITAVKRISRIVKL